MWLELEISLTTASLTVFHKYVVFSFSFSWMYSFISLETILSLLELLRSVSFSFQMFQIFILSSYDWFQFDSIMVEKDTMISILKNLLRFFFMTQSKTHLLYFHRHLKESVFCFFVCGDCSINALFRLGNFYCSIFTVTDFYFLSILLLSPPIVLCFYFTIVSVNFKVFILFL